MKCEETEKRNDTKKRSFFRCTYPPIRNSPER
ncbi:hypothetical protein A2U01_0072823, partial [Trifolium medium]|nr:hypothetical protein [Trifolium medium]